MELFKSTGAWDQAIKVGQAALNVTPRDSVLEKSLNELAAEQAMAEGGYNEAIGEEGGYRKFIRNASGQQELDLALRLDVAASFGLTPDDLIGDLERSGHSGGPWRR